MENLDELEQSLDTQIDLLEENRESLEKQEIERKEMEEATPEILVQLENLEGDARAKVEEQLEREKAEKDKAIEGKRAFIEVQKRELESKQQQLEAAMEERKSALDTLQHLGDTTGADVRGGVQEINEEMQRMEADLKRIQAAIQGKE